MLGCDRACRGWQRGLGSGRHAGTSLVRDSRGGQAQGLGSHLESQFLLAESRLRSPDAGGAPSGPCGAEQREWNLRAWAVVWRREGRAQVPPVPHASSDPCDGSRNVIWKIHMTSLEPDRPAAPRKGGAARLSPGVGQAHWGPRDDSQDSLRPTASPSLEPCCFLGNRARVLQWGVFMCLGRPWVGWD